MKRIRCIMILIVLIVLIALYVAGCYDVMAAILALIVSLWALYKVNASLD